nr:immunoglobulin heavy chain junction region [Macaca mulatta]MOY23644.1 immunoglobulin heavy chain junction region [Macaca mulatta]
CVRGNIVATGIDYW